MHSHERSDAITEFLISSVAGLAYGSTSVIVGHPLDTVKTKMQAQASYIGEKGLKHTIEMVWAEGKIPAFYKGALFPLLGSSIYRSLQFSVYEGLYTKWTNHSILGQDIPFTGGLQGRVIVGSFFGSLARTLIECPIEYIKVRKQVGKTWHFKSIYTGVHYNFMRIFPILTIFIMHMDYFRRKTDILKTELGKLLAGGWAATVGWWVVWPIETIKNQVQAGTQSIGNTFSEREKYLENIHGKLGGIYRGIVPGTISIFLRNSCSFYAMLKVQTMFTEMGYRQKVK